MPHIITRRRFFCPRPPSLRLPSLHRRQLVSAANAANAATQHTRRQYNLASTHGKVDSEWRALLESIKSQSEPPLQQQIASVDEISEQESTESFTQLEYKVRQRLLQIYKKEQLASFVEEIKRSSPRLGNKLEYRYLAESKDENFVRSNNTWMAYHKQAKNPVTRAKIDWLYLYLFRFNNDLTDVAKYNKAWIKIHETHGESLVQIYLSSYICSLLNTRQTHLAIRYFVQWLVEGKVDLTVMPLAKILDVMIGEGYAEDLATVLRMCLTKSNLSPMAMMTTTKSKMMVGDDVWVRILNFGLTHDVYELVQLAYCNFIMRDYPDGKISIEDVVLSNSKDNAMLRSFSNNLLMQILRCFASHGDVDSTIDLIESHFFHKVVAGGDAMTGELCVEIIESHCHDKSEDVRDKEKEEQQEEDIEKIVELVDVFVRKSIAVKTEPITAQDLFLPMGRLFSAIDKGKNEAMFPRLNLVNILEIATRDDLLPETKEIFEKCLLDYMMNYRSVRAAVDAIAFTMKAAQFSTPR
ncbi:uncharacterized protein LODBEIA_P23820 [Lodderomyces beijingensis]|uniref:Uncharacterized protein n=1 Tax=Lodderomyces beijingensis TaxID=1775926 RepID=A0ABP0ZJ40_9ASCO